MSSHKGDVVYTAIFGNYDEVPSINPEWNCDFICFTDNPDMISNGWKIKVVQLNGEAPSYLNRRYKIFPHIYLSEYERSLYVDGNIKIMSDPSTLFDKYLNVSPVAIPIHSERNCAYKEAAFCIKVQLANKEITEQQMARYEAEGFPRDYGLSENNIIFRKHLNPMVIHLMNSWWQEYSNGGRRDQLSLQYLIWKNNFKFTFMTEAARNKNIYFRSIPHSNVKQLSLLRRFSRAVVFNKHRNYFYKMADILINIVRFFLDNTRKILKNILH